MKSRVKLPLVLLLSAFLLNVSSMTYANDKSANIIAEASPSAWLDKMARAVKEQNYRGSLVHASDDQWHTLSVSHAVVNGMEYERLFHLTGEAQEVIRQGHDVTCVHPGENVLRLHAKNRNPLHGNDAYSSAKTSKYYQMMISAGERIAGYDTQLLTLQASDEHRYSYRLWLEDQTGLLLRSDVMYGNRTLERLQYADIEIGVEIPMSDFQPKQAGHQVASHPSHAKDQATVSPDQWMTGWVPRGFMMADQKSSDSSKKATLMYTDGLSAISVFVEPAALSERKPFMSNRWGATAAAITYVGDSQRLFRVTVVGEVPQMTVDKMARSVTITAN